MIFLLALTACLPDDVNTPGTYDNVAGDTGPTGNGGGDTDTGNGGGDTDTGNGGGGDTETGSSTSGTIVGDWRSEGADLSELFAPYYSWISAAFRKDGSYTVVATDTDGKSVTFIGTYAADTRTDPANIELVQTSPSNAVSDGIYAVDGDTLTYEVVIVEPSYGYTPATPASGFGSTSGPKLGAGQNVQTYRRQ